jgi:hypothetical protein
MLRSGIAVGEALPVDGLGERTANVVLYIGPSIARKTLVAPSNSRRAQSLRRFRGVPNEKCKIEMKMYTTTKQIKRDRPRNIIGVC